MDCRNCGAPMELFDRRRYYYCHHCGTFHFIESPVHDGIRVLGPSQTPFPCPLCAATLVRSLLDERFVVQHCERCRGVLLERQTFGEAVLSRRARATGPPADPVPVDSRELNRSVTCPSCKVRMDVHPYYGPGNIVIDTCSRCELIWLDHGELRQITDAPGRDRGSSREAAARPLQAAQPRARRAGRLSLLDVFEDLLD